MFTVQLDNGIVIVNQIFDDYDAALDEFDSLCRWADEKYLIIGAEITIRLLDRSYTDRSYNGRQATERVF